MGEATVAAEASEASLDEPAPRLDGWDTALRSTKETSAAQATLALLMASKMVPFASPRLRGVASGFGYEATNDEAPRAMAEVPPLSAKGTVPEAAW